MMDEGGGCQLGKSEAAKKKEGKCLGLASKKAERTHLGMIWKVRFLGLYFNDSFPFLQIMVLLDTRCLVFWFLTFVMP